MPKIECPSRKGDDNESAIVAVSLNGDRGLEQKLPGIYNAMNTGHKSIKRVDRIGCLGDHRYSVPLAFVGPEEYKLEEHNSFAHFTRPSTVLYV